MIKWLLQISKTNRRGLFGVRRSNAMQQPSYFSLIHTLVVENYYVINKY